MLWLMFPANGAGSMTYTTVHSQCPGLLVRVMMTFLVLLMDTIRQLMERKKWRSAKPFVGTKDTTIVMLVRHETWLAGCRKLELHICSHFNAACEYRAAVCSTLPAAVVPRICVATVCEECGMNVCAAGERNTADGAAYPAAVPVPATPALCV